MAERPMLIFVSDIHLTDSLHGAAVSKADTFERFWTRIQAARGARPAEICFVGDLFDLVRSPSWFESRARPYHESGGVAEQVDAVVEATLAREAAFFTAIRTRVQAGELAVHYLLGNHDRLLRDAPRARRAIWNAFTGEDRDVTFESEREFRDHGVLAYHGHIGDVINASPGGHATIGDAIGSELIVRFPRAVRQLAGEGYRQLDDIDDVRPIYAVPAWVRRLGAVDRELLRPVNDVWARLVEDFLSIPFVREWMRAHHKTLGLDAGKKLRLLLELSTKRVMAHTHDRRLTQIYKYFQHSFDGRMARRAAEELSRRRGLRYVVNGHSHFSSMVPLGTVDGAPCAYFNTGTWRTVHQIGYDVGGRPSFLAFDAMCYLVFFPGDDPLRRDYEWWTGAMVSRSAPAGARLHFES
jgi:UDP-2,3-diacylglucosamine pyrophosphatase LpxH